MDLFGSGKLRRFHNLRRVRSEYAGRGPWPGGGCAKRREAAHTDFHTKSIPHSACSVNGRMGIQPERVRKMRSLLKIIHSVMWLGKIIQTAQPALSYHQGSPTFGLCQHCQEYSVVLHAQRKLLTETPRTIISLFLESHNVLRFVSRKNHCELGVHPTRG